MKKQNQGQSICRHYIYCYYFHDFSGNDYRCGHEQKL